MTHTHMAGTNQRGSTRCSSASMTTAISTRPISNGRGDHAVVPTAITAPLTATRTVNDCAPAVSFQTSHVKSAIVMPNETRSPVPPLRSSMTP